MHRILITGCNGFVAHYLIDYIKNHGIDAHFHGIDVSEKSVIEGLPYTSMNLMDIECLKNVLTAYRPTHIAHFASVSSVSQSWEKPVESFTNNTNIFLNIVESVRKLGLSPRILSVGSSEEYGNYPQHALPLKEDYELRPCSPYAIARVAQEMISKLYANSFGLEIVMTRSFNHIGPGQRELFAIPSFIRQMLTAKGENLSTISVGNIDIVRDFLDVRDVVDAYCKILFLGRQGEVYNVCRGVGISLREIIQKISEILDFFPEIRIDPTKVRPADNQMIVGDPSKLITELGWSAAFSLEMSLRETITHMSEHG